MFNAVTAIPHIIDIWSADQQRSVVDKRCILEAKVLLNINKKLHQIHYISDTQPMENKCLHCTSSEMRAKLACPEDRRFRRKLLVGASPLQKCGSKSSKTEQFLQHDKQFYHDSDTSELAIS